MNIQTHAPDGQTALDRKELVQIISETLGMESTYLNRPTFAYRIGPVSVERNGSLEINPGEEWNKVMPKLMMLGYIDAIPQTESSQRKNAESERNTEITLSIEDMTPIQLKNLVHILFNKYEIIGLAAGEKVFFVAEEVIRYLRVDDFPFSHEEFVELMQKFERCEYLKGIHFSNQNITFTLPYIPEDEENFTFFFNRILQKARLCKRVYPHRQKIESEKYSMHQFCADLGLVGDKHKDIRQAMRRRLKGASSFKNKKEAEAHKKKWGKARIRFLEEMEKRDEVVHEKDPS